MSNAIRLRLPAELVRKLDTLVAEGSFPARDAAVAAALDRLETDEDRRAIDRAIVEGYTRIPPTAEEIAWAEASTRRSIVDEPW